MLTVFTAPSRYTQGKGATSELGREMNALGLEGPVLIIASGTVIGLLSPVWQRSLDEAGFKHAVHRFCGECCLSEIERVKSAGRQLGADNRRRRGRQGSRHGPRGGGRAWPARG